MQSLSRTDDGTCTRTVVSREVSGKPRTYRLTPRTSRASAYRRLAISILRLDVATLSAELQATRRTA
jgi:hypothetical protein